MCAYTARGDSMYPYTHTLARTINVSTCGYCCDRPEGDFRVFIGDLGNHVTDRQVRPHAGTAWQLVRIGDH